LDASEVEDAAAGRGWDLLMAKMGKIADWVGVSAPLLDGEIVDVSDIEGAGNGSVVFAVDGEVLKKALASKAGAILANKRLESAELPLDPRVLWVADARYAFALVARGLRGRGFEAGVHPSAIVGGGVSIGVGTSVGPGVVLGMGL
jgi:UDP-3-O-[3-hydroxymyristoyl] glucosamine N-acyltransferase